MFCGLKLRSLLSFISSPREMKGSPEPSKRKTARRQSCSQIIPDTPSQNTRAAKKRRRMNLQKQYSQEKQLTGQSKETDRATDMLVNETLAVMQSNIQVEPNKSCSSTNVFRTHEEDTTMLDQGIDLDPTFPCECCMPFAPNHNTLFCRPSLELGRDDKDIVIITTTEELDWHDQVEDASQCRFCNALGDAQLSRKEGNPSMLFQLPLELRQHIYSFVLPAVTGRPYLRYGKDIGWIKGACDLLRVNKQIYQEAVGVLYNSAIVEFDVNYKGVLVNATQKSGIWNSPEPKSLPDTGMDFDLARLRQVVINVPDMLSLEDWQSLEKHQAGIKENGGIELKPHLEKLVDVLVSECKELRQVQVNLRVKNLFAIYALSTTTLT